MLSISLDEGAVFDILSINIVKFQRNPNNVVADAMEYMVDEIKSQIGIQKFIEVTESEEFKELIRINGVVFDLIDKAQKGDGFAREVQDGNFKRYTQKTLLQKKFFNTNVTEIKL